MLLVVPSQSDADLIFLLRTAGIRYCETVYEYHSRYATHKSFFGDFSCKPLHSARLFCILLIYWMLLQNPPEDSGAVFRLMRNSWHPSVWPFFLMRYGLSGMRFLLQQLAERSGSDQPVPAPAPGTQARENGRPGTTPWPSRMVTSRLAA